jgi:hypothetical protein
MRYLMFMVAAAMLLCGCAVVKRPPANVTSVAVTEQTDQGGRIEVVVDLVNPNDDTPLPMPRAIYTVTVGDDKTFHFEQIPAATLPAAGVQTLTLPAAFADAAPLAGQPYRVTGRVEYTPPGEIRRILTDSGLPLPSSPFSAQGTLQEKP